ncbi:hypothetical protein BN2475_60008 [Paraburkholderia ribeironis]|uniref:Glycosyltransferase n=1 Tax=Paraburkholderia ribeironis TaxID=1247936 RepID=A0A1N7RLF5_9BURK|nr:hypothetical protein [Paraburkholderia ribeironis]SIT35929.1 hypothetical protein BN2475_60008 [Paraburkholderia ribeironis]
MKIGLVELRKHCEVLDALVRQVLASGGTPTIFTNRFCAEASTVRGLLAEQWQVCPQGLSNVEFIDFCRPLIVSLDHVLFTTPVDDLCGLLAGNSVGTPAYFCLVHNFNTFIAEGDGRRNAEIARLVLSGAARILLPDLRLANATDQRRARAINIAYPEFAPQVFDRQEVRCCVPGRVYEGRDCAGVLAALALAAPRLEQRLTVDFLGQNDSGEFAAAIQAVRPAVSPRVVLRDHSGYVAQDVFDTVLAEADFLILPITESIVRNGVIETRGQTCVTGNINDMVRFGLPALIPRFYPLSSHLAPIAGRYDSPRSMADLIVDWVNTGAFNRRKLQATAALAAYRAECLCALDQVLGQGLRDPL